MHEDVGAKGIKTALSEFLAGHSSAAVRPGSAKQLLLYRALQGEHANDFQVQECRRIQDVVDKRFQLIFGKKIALKEFGGTTAMQAAHVAPFSGLFSWQNDMLIQSLFQKTLAQPLKTEYSKGIVKEDIGLFADSIQKSGTADPQKLRQN